MPGGSSRLPATDCSPISAASSTRFPAPSRCSRPPRDLNAASPPDRHLQLRIGVNLGDVIVADDNDLYGDGVNIAARLQALAAPGGICLSHTVYEQVKNKLALDYRSLGSAPGQEHRRAGAGLRGRSGGARGGAAVYPLARADRRRGCRDRHRGRPCCCGTRPVACQSSAVGAASRRRPSRHWLCRPAWPNARRSRYCRSRTCRRDAGQDFFSDGITEDIINALGRFSNLLVAAKSASFQFKGHNVSPEEAGRALDVRYLVEGSVRRAGDRLRITVELTEAATGVHLWSDVYNTELKDIFTVQDEITERIVGAAAVKLTRLERDARLAQAHRESCRL